MSRDEALFDRTKALIENEVFNRGKVNHFRIIKLLKAKNLDFRYWNSVAAELIREGKIFWNKKGWLQVTKEYKDG